MIQSPASRPDVAPLEGPDTLLDALSLLGNTQPSQQPLRERRGWDSACRPKQVSQRMLRTDRTQATLMHCCLPRLHGRKELTQHGDLANRTRESSWFSIMLMSGNFFTANSLSGGVLLLLPSIVGRPINRGSQYRGTCLSARGRAAFHRGYPNPQYMSVRRSSGGQSMRACAHQLKVVADYR